MHMKGVGFIKPTAVYLVCLVGLMATVAIIHNV